MKKLFSLFLTFFKIGLFTFGGGYAMLSLIQSETVTRKQWLGGDELLDIIAISESTPGPISINCATYIGYKRAGFLGSFFATLGVVLPSFLIIFAISFFIEDFLKIELVSRAFKGIQAAVAVLIIRAGFKMIKNIKKDVLSFVLLAIALALTVTLNFVAFNLSSIYLIIFGGVVGLIYYTFVKKDRAVETGDSADTQSENKTGEIAESEAQGEKETSEIVESDTQGEKETSNEVRDEKKNSDEEEGR